MKRLFLALLVGVASLGFTLSAGAVLSPRHEINGTPSANCTIFLGNFKDFPNATNVITAKVGAHTATQSFHGTSGSVTYAWTSLGVNTALGGTISYSFSWTADGGGTAGPYTFNAASCHTTTPTTVVPSTPTIPPTTPTTPVTPTTPTPTVPVTPTPPAATPPAAVPAPAPVVPVTATPAPKPVHHKAVPKKTPPKKTTPKPRPYVVIPQAHTGEPWAGADYWMLLEALFFGALVALYFGFRKVRHN